MTVLNARKMFAAQEGPPNALALNKENTQVVIAGRNVFKVYEIKDDEFFEKANLRVGKNLNLNFSCNDVVWNVVEEQWLATAATNGAVVLWNLNRPSRMKQEMVFTDHRRTVNKVTFHSKDANLLLSGSQDGTMKCFDIRQKEAVSTFFSNAESVRDVQFSPHHNFAFVAVSENGNVQTWDLRRTDRCEKQFTAHSGPVFACDWHPEMESWLATAGRDRTIKIWDLGPRPILTHTIQTIASVGRIKWRPQRRNHIASAALVVDSTINVWDIRRPYVPFATFNEHKDITTGIVWRGDPHVLLSTSKDCTLYQHVFKEVIRPADKANPVSAVFNASGDVGFASRSRSNAPTKNKNTGFITMVKKPKDLSEEFLLATSTLHIFHVPEPSVSWATVFVSMAKQYQITGKPFGDMCDYNAKLALDLRQPQVAVTWNMVKVLFAASSFSEWSFPKGNLLVREDSNTNGGSEADLKGLVKIASSSGPASAAGEGYTSGDRVDTSGAVSEEAESDNEETETQERTLTHIASGMAHIHADMFFGDVDADTLNFGGGLIDFAAAARDSSALEVLEIDGEEDWNLPTEAFQPRHEIKDRSPPPEHFPRDNFDTSNDPDTTTVKVEDQTSTLLCLTGSCSPVPWNGTSVVGDMLCQLANEGDVQTAVSLLLVLGERVKRVVSNAQQEQWYLSYLDLLSRFQLWDICAQIIKLSPIHSVNHLSQQSTTVHTCCNRCSRALLRSGWFCNSCKGPTNTCSICHLGVRGLYVWCQGCSHGGHLHHMQQWFQTQDRCPTGCGHLCEFG